MSNSPDNRPLALGRALQMLLLVALVVTGCTAAWGDGAERAGSAATLQQIQPSQPPPSSPSGQSPDGFAVRPIVQQLESPLEVIYGPDGFLWITERIGKRVSRINPTTGEQRVAITIWEAYQSGLQDGLLGMVLHPELLQGTGNDYVYLAYTYLPASTAAGQTITGTDTITATDETATDETTTDDTGADANAASLSALNQRRVKIRRYTYDPQNEILRDPVDLLADLPGSNDHNSGRFVFSPDETLFYAIGDQGNNQFNRACLPIRAQELPTTDQLEAADWSAYPGKILRLNLDGSIPEDNPTINGVQSHIYSYGHRNIQGLALGPDGHLYASEHGPKTDDEINLIQEGKNYGWPYVAGYQDDQAYVYANWSAADNCQSLTYSDFAIPAAVPTQAESDWNDPDFVPPIYTFGTVPSDYEFQPEVCAPNYYICWPTVAPTGVEVYADSAETIAQWPTSLLVTALKTGTVYRLELGEDGTTVVGDAVPLVKTTNRYRDLFLHPTAGAFYVITDSSNNTQGSFGIPTTALEHPGAILQFSNSEPE